MKGIRSYPAIFGGAAAVIIFFYISLHTRAFIEYIDDSFSLSSVYIYQTTGTSVDTIFSAPDNPDRFLYFRKTFYAVYGAILEVIGWEKGHAYIISTAVLVLCSALWWLFMRRLGYPVYARWAVSLLLLFMLPFFTAAHRGRDDPLTLLCIITALLLFSYRRYFFAGFASLVACEIHPMGSLALFFIAGLAALEWYKNPEERRQLYKNLGWLSLGAVMGVGYYFALHHDILSIDGILGRFKRANQFDGQVLDPPVRSYFLIYWFDPRFLAETLFFSLALFVYIKKKWYREDPVPGVLMLAAVLHSFITGRPNLNYLGLGWTPFVFASVIIYERWGRLKEAFVLLMIYLSVLYGMRLYNNYDYDYPQIAARTYAAVPVDTLPVVALPDNWFIFRERQFYPLYNRPDILTLGLKEFYFVRNDYLAYKYPLYEKAIEAFSGRYTIIPVARFQAWRDHYVEIFKYTLK